MVVAGRYLPTGQPNKKSCLEEEMKILGFWLNHLHPTTTLPQLALEGINNKLYNLNRCQTYVIGQDISPINKSARMNIPD